VGTRRCATIHTRPATPRHGGSRPRPETLTARQREIAGLIARGLTNRQIAAELVLTAGTVANHVRAILMRTGFHTRSQVAAWLGVPERVGLEAAPDATAVLDGDGRILTANPALAALLGRSVRALESSSLGSIVVADGPVRGEDVLSGLVAEGAWRGELRVRRRDGTAVAVEMFAQALDTPAGTLYVAAFRDLSHRESAERRQREFVAMLGHELRSPLTAIRGYAQLMQRRSDGSSNALEVILHNTQRLERLVSDLIDLTRQDIGLLRLRRGPVDLVEIVRAVAEHARGMSPEHQVVVEAPDVPVVGDWDRVRLEQVLDNLVSNAVRYSPDGGRVVVRIAHRGPSAEVSVSDEGVGIPAEALPRLFDRFYRVERPEDPVLEGLGLGLAVVRALVEAHGGRVDATSTGRGSRLTVVLPYRAPEHT
jgi:two-component system phosphate regulon sensor histidine kinase PhoR